MLWWHTINCEGWEFLVNSFLVVNSMGNEGFRNLSPLPPLVHAHASAMIHALKQSQSCTNIHLWHC